MLITVIAAHVVSTHAERSWLTRIWTLNNTSTTIFGSTVNQDLDDDVGEHNSTEPTTA
jgi:hypothetical protein